MKRVFVGPKQTTIENSDFFDASITLVGNNKNGNTAFSSELPFDFWNDDNASKEVEIYNREIAKLKQTTEIMAHHPKVVFGCTLPDNVSLICKNPQSLLEIVDDKIQTRCLLKGIVPMIEYHTIKGEHFDYKQLRYISEDLVVQFPTGSGGSKTFLCKQKNSEYIKSILNSQKYYSISAYHRVNIPYNIHCLIGYDQIELLAPSQQELELSDKIEYIGSDYDVSIPYEVKNKLVQYSIDVCRKIQKMGYLGVLGIDYIYANSELYFIEINPRFQGSTRQVDGLLKKSRLPSIFDYNYRAFNSKEMPSTKKMKWGLE